VLECISSTVYQLECELECTGGEQVASPAGTRRRNLAYELRDHLPPQNSPKVNHAVTVSAARPRILQEEEETLDVHVASECPLSLVNSTTLQSLAATPALFVDCVALHYLWMFTDEGMEYVMGAAANETSSGGEEGAVSASADGEADADAAAGATSASSPSSYEGLFTPVAIVYSAILLIVSAVFV
jgi:hypothetical protein